MQYYASCKRRDNSTSDADIGNALNFGFLEGIYPDPERVVLNFSLHFQFENIIQLWIPTVRGISQVLVEMYFQEAN